MPHEQSSRKDDAGQDPIFTEIYSELRGTTQERNFLANELCLAIRSIVRSERGTLLYALEKIAELEGDTENQQFKLTRFQAAQIARFALLSERKDSQ